MGFQPCIDSQRFGRPCEHLDTSQVAKEEGRCGKNGARIHWVDTNPVQEDVIIAEVSHRL